MVLLDTRLGIEAKCIVILNIRGVPTPLVIVSYVD